MRTTRAPGSRRRSPKPLDPTHTPTPWTAQAKLPKPTQSSPTDNPFDGNNRRNEYPTSASPPLPGRPASALSELWGLYLTAFAVILLTTTVSVAAPSVRTALAHLLALNLHHRLVRAPRPTVLAAARLLANNLRSTGWPLLLLALGLGRLTWLRRLADVAVAGALLANLVPAGVALAAYGMPLVRYLPHLPCELWAIATGPGCWYLASRGRLSGRGLALAVALIPLALTVAAVLETWAVPHR